jgi:preprotein translocase subunit Sss1
MPNNNIHQELQELRAEIEDLKREKQETENIKIIDKKDIENSINIFKDNITEVFETLKKDYKNISPVTAIGLFTLGVIFGRTTSSK